jgi:hypothetical protein
MEIPKFNAFPKHYICIFCTVVCGEQDSLEYHGRFAATCLIVLKLPENFNVFIALKHNPRFFLWKFRRTIQKYFIRQQRN